MKNRDYFFIAVLFYLGWFGSVLLAKSQESLSSLFFPIFLAGFLIAKKSLTMKETKLALGIAAVGIIFDGLMVFLGQISATSDPTLQIPIWLISIWLLFSLSMIKLGGKLQPPFWIALLLGAIMGPLSYKSGEYFQVLTFNTSFTFLIYAVFWALAFPAVLTLTRRNA